MADYTDTMVELLKKLNQVPTAGPTLEDVGKQVQSNPFGYPDYGAIAEPYMQQRNRNTETMLGLMNEADRPAKKNLLDYLIPAAGLLQFGLQVGKDPESALTNLNSVNQTASDYRQGRQAARVSAFKKKMAELKMISDTDEANLKTLMESAKGKAEGITSTSSGVRDILGQQGEAANRQLSKIARQQSIVNDVNEANKPEKPPKLVDMLKEEAYRVYGRMISSKSYRNEDGSANVGLMFRDISKQRPDLLPAFQEMFGMDYVGPEKVLDNYYENAREFVDKKYPDGFTNPNFPNDATKNVTEDSDPEQYDILFNMKALGVIKRQFEIRGEQFPFEQRLQKEKDKLKELLDQRQPAPIEGATYPNVFPQTGTSDALSRVLGSGGRI